ncbi:MAG: DUF4397 domain-containing protein [Ferruginibacter sp.]|nr:DUF4397 domain-containing protein [Ferruginibacter sp.]
MYNKKNYFFSLAVICSLLFTINSCVKKDPESKITQVLFVPLSPNAIACDFSIDGTLYATTVNYSTTAGTIRYTFPYYTIETKAGSVIAYNATGTNNKFASVTKDLQEDKVYSTFLIDSVSKAKAVIVNDDLTEPTPGKVKIRFFHFSPNTPAVDVVISATSAKLFTNRAFNDQVANTAYENFIEVEPGNYTFLFNNVTTGLTAYTTSVQSLLPDRIYTLAARGFTGGAGAQALGAWVYPNKP